MREDAPVTGQSLRRHGAAAALTLLSGALMMVAGYLGHTESWATAGLVAIAGGVVIVAAFAVARAADRTNDFAPAPEGTSARRSEGFTSTLLSGGLMVFAGYAGAAWSWALAAALALMGGLVIASAFLVAR